MQPNPRRKQPETNGAKVERPMRRTTALLALTAVAAMVIDNSKPWCINASVDTYHLPELATAPDAVVVCGFGEPRPARR